MEIIESKENKLIKSLKKLKQKNIEIVKVNF